MSDPVENGVTVRLSGRALAALEEIRRRLGGQVTPGDVIGTALGTELYLLRFADEDRADTVWVEQTKGKYRQKLTVKPEPRGDDAGNHGR